MIIDIFKHGEPGEDRVCLFVGLLRQWSEWTYQWFHSQMSHAITGPQFHDL